MTPQDIVDACQMSIDDSDASTDSTGLAAMCLVMELAKWVQENCT